jgi:NTP pyrophosphatase (non-canonical NTP hydrolase)
MQPEKKLKRPRKIRSLFGYYYKKLEEIDQRWKDTKEFGSFLILSLVEEVGEMARAYLAKHGRKPTNIAAQKDERYDQELGDIVVAILRFARIKNIDLHKRIMYSINKIKRRQKQPKV